MDTEMIQELIKAIKANNLGQFCHEVNRDLDPVEFKKVTVEELRKVGLDKMFTKAKHETIGAVHSGGGIMLLQFELESGKFFSMSDEVFQLFASEEDLENDCGDLALVTYYLVNKHNQD